MVIKQKEDVKDKNFNWK